MTNWQERDKNTIWHPFSALQGNPPNLHIVRGEGVYLITEDGQKIIDAVSSWWVNLHGHAHPAITKAIADQAATLEHVIFAGFTHSPAVKLAEALLKIVPGNMSKVFYSDNGSTAVEVAIKIAFQYWYNKQNQKTKIIALDGAYHGDTFGAMSVGERSIFTKPFYPYLFDVEFLPFPTGDNDQEIINTFGSLLSTNQVAAFIFEPLVQGASGMRMYSATLLDQLIQLASEKNVITIADEVMTGFGRTGKLFASDYLQNKPDIICLSKGITGGALPLGATVCSDKILEPFQSPELSLAFLHGHSYTANPLACAAALASYELLMTGETMANIDRIGKQHLAFRNKISGNHLIKDVRAMGTILAIELKSEENGSYLSEMRNQLYPFFLERNILLRPLGNLIYILPPYVISSAELDQIYQAIEDFLLTR